MAGDYVIILQGLPDVDVSQIDRDIIKAARMSINDTAKWTRTRAAEKILEQVNLPKSYVTPGSGRLAVSQLASDHNLEAVISGRKRATSLARFVTAKTKKGLMVSVKRGGGQKEIPGSFLMPLRSGEGGPNGNMGLAVRTSKGKRPSNAYKPVQIADNLWLLYGPSVDQVFQTVRDDVTPGAEERLANTFARLFDLKLGG